MFVMADRFEKALFRLGGVLGLAALVLAGCARPAEITTADIAAIDFAQSLETCCAGEDRVPVALVNLVETSSISVVPLSRSIVLRDSYLQDVPEAQALIIGQARPLDMILISNGSRLSGVAGSGYFGHAAVYTGTEADLRALGVWSHPAVAKFHQRIRAGGIAIESIDLGVRLSDAYTLMEADSAALFQVRGLSRERRRAALIYLFTEIGKPFDHHFDLDTNDAIYCTELIHDALPEMNMPVRINYGRRAIWPDEVATKSLQGETGFRFVTYVRGSPFGWREESWQVMVARILRAWQ